MRIVLSILIYCLVCFFINYANDRPTLPREANEISMPSVFDIKIDKKKYCFNLESDFDYYLNDVIRAIDKYENEVILESYDFVRIKKEISKDNGLENLILYFFCVIYQTKNFMDLFSEVGFLGNSNFWNFICSIIASSAICLLVGWLVYLIYNKWFAIKKFSLTTDQIAARCYLYTEDLNISKDRFIKNESIRIYYEYLLLNQTKTNRRLFARKVMHVIATIIALLLFNPGKYT